MRTASTLLGIVIALGLNASVANAQRGVGKGSGVAAQVSKPETIELSGTVASIETGPCENTTGRALSGTHLLLKSAEGEELNVHLGPERAVAPVVARLQVGEPIRVTAFRTEKLQKRHFVAQALMFGKVPVVLRDEATLQPVWAGRGGRGGQGGAQAWGGAGRGRGAEQGQTAGRGYGKRHRWGGSHGCAARGQGKGRGPGVGPGGGRGPGAGGGRGAGHGRGR